MKIYEFYEDNENFYIINEFCDQGDIAEKMDKEGTLSEFIVRYFMNQVFRAVSYLHSQKIIHGDIKRENILLEKINNEDNLDSSNVIQILNNDKQITQELRNSKKLISKKTKDKVRELSKFEIKLVDFGSAKLFNKKKKITRGNWNGLL
jgi:serine/threonine protein kinase